MFSGFLRFVEFSVEQLIDDGSSVPKLIFTLSVLSGYTFPGLPLDSNKVLLLLLICYSPAFDSISSSSFSFMNLRITILQLMFIHRSSTRMNRHS